MPDTRHLQQPPIIEALLHFQANASSRWDEGGCKQLAESLFQNHKQINARRNFAVQWTRLDAEEPEHQALAEAVSGYMLRSASEPTAHQVCRDGYTFSRLLPYISWEQFVASALEGWNAYSKAFVPDPLHGLVVRFLNRLEFPLDDLTDNGESLLTIAPRSPQGLNWNFINFAHQYSFSVPKSACIANVNLFRLHDQNPIAAAMMLEVEVSITNLAAFGLDIDTALKELRRVKNEAFFHSLTDKALSRYNLPQS